MQCWLAGNNFTVNSHPLPEIGVRGRSRWRRKKKGRTYGCAEGINVQRRKCLISVFFPICSLHPVSWLLLHREPRFYHWASLWGDTLFRLFVLPLAPKLEEKKNGWLRICNMACLENLSLVLHCGYWHKIKLKGQICCLMFHVFTRVGYKVC